VADGGEDDVGGIASAALEIAAAEVSFGLQVADHGLDGGSASQLAFDHSEDAALLARDEDAAWILRVMAPVSLIDIGPTSGSSILKGNGSGGFSSAVAGTDYATTTNATFQSNVASPQNPTATTSTSVVMMGLGGTCKITPAITGRMMLQIQGNITNSTNTTITEIQGRYGTGTAPSNAAAATGTSFTSPKDFQPLVASSPLSSFHIGSVVTGLALSTQVWFDLSAAVSGVSTGTVSKIDCYAVEF
jgi:hypothetical protein